MQRQHSPAQVHVGEGKDAQVQRRGGRQDVAQKTGERGLDAMRQRAVTGNGRAETKENKSLLYHLLIFHRAH